MKRQFLTGRILYLSLAVLMLVSIAVPVSAQGTDNSDRLLADTLRQYVEELKAEPDAKGMIVGYEVYSLDRRETLASMREDKTLVPASTMKLLVTSTVLNRLSPGFRFQTELYTDGKLTKGGVLQGDVILKGYGDPALSPQRLQQLARTLANKGVRRIHGNLVVDDTYFDSKRLGTNWMWDDEQYDYSAQIGALSVNENTVDVQVMPTKPGKKPRVSVSPAPDYIKIINKAKTVEGNQTNLSIDRIRATNEIVVTGTIGAQYDVRYATVNEDSMTDIERAEKIDKSHLNETFEGVKVTRTIDGPALFTGHVLRDLLEKEGIAFKNKSKIVTGQLSKSSNRITTTYSPPLDNILDDFVKESDNFVAEMLLKQLGAREREDGSAKAGIAEIASFVEDVLGMDPGFVQKDASGLSRQNVITPHQLVQLLAAMDEHPAGERFRSFLPVAGKDGTLKNRMIGTPAEGNVQAKTGSMSGVNTLAGYVQSAAGERLAFSIMLNGVYKSVHARNLQDRIAVALASYPDLPQPSPLPEEPTYPLSSRFDPILDDSGYKGVIKGVAVHSLDNGDILYERNARSLMTPASSTKLLTSGTALALLGPDYRFRTEVYRTGPLRNGILHGDLVIKGYGDPTLATEGSLSVQDGPTVEQMVKDIQALGLRQIKGDIIVDGSVFSDQVYGEGWAWDNESDYYQPQITALSINRGTVRFDYLPGDKPGDDIKLTLSPKTDYVSVIDDSVTGVAGSKNTLKIERDRGTNTIRLTGSLPLDFKGDYTRITVEKPQLYTGHVLRDQLQDSGIRLQPKSEVREAQLPTGVPHHLMNSYQSPPLSDVVRYLNYYSDNFYAEMILKTIGLETYGEGTFDNGLKAVQAFNNQLGITSRADMMDGSGLTRYNQFSADQLVSLLVAMEEQPTFEAFYDSLPVAGEEGALKNRMRGTEAEHNLRGKTGSMTHVRALSGYVETRDGERLAYAILTNGYTDESLSALEDRLGVAMAEFSR